MAGVKRSAPDDEVDASGNDKSSSKRGDEESESDGSNAFTGNEEGHNLEKGDATAAAVGADDADGGQEKMQDDDDDVKEEEGGGGGAGSQASKRQKVEQLDEVPLLIPSAVAKDTKASLLVHLRDENLDFSGDTGAVGRIAVSGKKKGRGLTFDLKGQQFGGQIIPSATVLVVGVGRTEAKVEGLFSEVCRLEYKGSVFASMGGEVLKGEMDESYKFQDEDVNARGAGGGAGGADDGGQKEGGGKTPKSARKKSAGKKKGSSSVKKGTKAPGGKAKK